MRGLLIFLAITYIIYRLSRYMAKRYFMSYMGKVNQQMHDQAQRQQRQQQSRREGQVNVDYIPENAKGNKKDKGGDYVDYEVVK